MQRAIAILALASNALPGVNAQSLISLKAGLLTYAEGRVQDVGGVSLVPRSGAFHVQTGQTLVTRRGRAELLLGPGVFLRLAEESAIVMESDSLVDTRVRLERGTAIVDAVEVVKGNLVRIVVGNSIAEIRQPGIFRFDANANEARVYDGKIDVAREGSSPVALKKGRLLALTAGAKPQSFERGDIDRLHRWSARRSLAVAQSNLVSARTTHGFGWKRFARSWIFSLYANSGAARSRPAPVPSG